MARRPKYELIFAPETLDHLDTIERKHHGLIQRAIDEQLRYTPERETRNRKPLEPTAALSAAWELRFGPRNQFRVFYEVDSGERIVYVLAIGVKQGSTLRIGGQEIEL